MKKKAIQTLVMLASKGRTPQNSTNILQTVNTIPKANQVDIEYNAHQYAIQQMENTYGIKIQDALSAEQQQIKQDILSRIKQIKKMKSLRLADLIQRLSQRMIYGELEQAKQFLQTLDRQELHQHMFILDILHKVVRQRLQKEQEICQFHTIDAARSLIQELKKAKLMDYI